MRTPRFLLTACLVVLTAAGCKKSGPAPSEPAAGAKKPKIALVMKSLANEFFKTMESAARQHADAHAGDYTLVTNGIKDEQDVGRQIDLVEQMVGQGVDALVLAPADSKALISAVKRALDTGVVVVNIDNRLDAQILAEKGMKVPFVGPENRKGARLAGTRLGETLGKGAKVAIIEGLPTAFNSLERRRGFEEAVAATGLTLVGVQAGNWEMDKANQVASAIIGEHPDLKGILCANDTMALGAVAALKAAGKSGAVQVVGFDDIAAVRDLVKKGQILATVEQHGGDLAVFGIEHALTLLRTKQAPADRETPVEVVTADAIK